MKEYQRSDPPAGLDPAVAEYISEELMKIEEAFADQTGILLRPQAKLPRKLREGMVVNFSDQVLGAGAGLYVYRNSGWNKLEEQY